jgi:hypothetical protein
MRKISVVIALSLSLFACGQQEKAENPFGRTKDPSKDGKEMTEKEFKDDCSRKKGTLREADTICSWTAHSFTLTEEMKKDLELNSITHFLGEATQGAMVWGAAEGGQRVYIDLNGSNWLSMKDTALDKTPTNAGRISLRIDAGRYDFVNAYIAECFSRAGAVPCPAN